MVDFCRQKYAGSRSDLLVIEEFEDYYDARDAIFWYTRDTFPLSSCKQSFARTRY